jgi:hypothetical protein
MLSQAAEALAGVTEAIACPGALWTLTAQVICCLQIVDASILKQYIFQKGFITEAAKAKREAEAQNATLQVPFRHLNWPLSQWLLLKSGLIWA